MWKERAISTLDTNYAVIDFDTPDENKGLRYTTFDRSFQQILISNENGLEALINHFLKNIYNPVDTLILCSTRNQVKAVYHLLKGLGISCEELHGGSHQHSRETSTKRFEKGQVCVLVASMTLGGTGMNFQGVDQLILYGVPETLETYVGDLCRGGRLKHQFKSLIIYYLYSRHPKGRNAWDYANFFRDNNVSCPKNLCPKGIGKRLNAMEHLFDAYRYQMRIFCQG